MKAEKTDLRPFWVMFGALMIAVLSRLAVALTELPSGVAFAAILVGMFATVGSVVWIGTRRERGVRYMPLWVQTTVGFAAIPLSVGFVIAGAVFLMQSEYLLALLLLETGFVMLIIIIKVLRRETSP